MNLIFDEIEYLGDNPKAGKDISHVRKNYRCAKVKSHIIFYRQPDNKTEIEIIRVLHQRMDIENRLND
ncbi:MAG: type II toxin-antitoxin system RelE/ParE family toxin [Bacteroidetes bacterium]|nr:type II toxin-antitoxin system RelE/ParE family toxin [Bacteroidota bacterium]